MRRTLWIVPAVAAVALAGAVLWKPRATQAEPENTAPAPAPAQSAPELPVTRAVLFSSGVGYFQREGRVEGDARLTLSFPARDVNDLLKSLVLQDLGGGQVGVVGYDSPEPVEKTLQSFAVNLTNNPSLSQILDQVRGEKVEITLKNPAPGHAPTLAGSIVGVERQQQPVGRETLATAEMLNLWSPDGVQSVRLADVQRIHFLNPALDAEVGRALGVLAASHDRQKRAVHLAFQGQGRRPVRVGYVVENPVWKTSYRLLLGKGGKAFLQGWAVVENITDEDWKDVRMTLVSGRPISFQMDLYQSLFVPRPVVVPELFASLVPQTYGGELGKAPGDALPAETPGGMGGGGGRGSGAGKGLAGGYPAAVPVPARTPYRKIAEMEGKKRDEDKDNQDLSLQQGVASAAAAGELGEFFQYRIEQPVSLPRRQSALLPIVNQDVKGAKVSIYNESVLAKFPMLGLRFHNTTGLHLMQGPITVFEDNSYAGDARIMDIQPGEERLLSYAIDLGTEVEAASPRRSDRLLRVVIQKGILHATSTVREEKVYHVKNRSEHDRTVLIEHPYRPAFHLITPDKPAERSREVYRFQLDLPAGKSARRDVIEEQQAVEQVTLTNLPDERVQFFLRASAVSERVKEALRRAGELKARAEATAAEAVRLEQQLRGITEDQARLRANLKELPPTAPAYKRYLDKFDKQETEVEGLQAKIKTLRDAEQAQRREYDSFLASLSVE